MLWQELRTGQIENYKFNKQKPLDSYIVDFYYKKLNLVIEVDGNSHYHDEAQIKDAIRQKVLEKMELSFLRFDNLDVEKNKAFVLSKIYHFIKEWESKNPPNPL